MPIHLPPMTRREFLTRTIAAGAGLVLPATALRAAAAASADPHTFALLSDTHVDADAKTVKRGVNMADHFRQAAAEVCALAKPPASVIVNGDCAFLKGLRDDYRQFASILKSLLDARLPVHLVLGNHDHRGNLRSVLMAARPAKSLVEGWRVSLIESPRANWFLLDSLDAVNSTPGKLGKQQLTWLARALDARADKPAIVMAHHNPELAGVKSLPKRKKTSGLTDSDALFDVLVKRRHVKAYVFGHRHQWGRAVYKGIHLVDLPAVAYVFGKNQPHAWVLARLADAGMTLDLHSLKPDHKAHRQKVELKWLR